MEFIVLVCYFIPLMVAVCRRHRILATFLWNFFLGWTLIGWFIALILATGHSSYLKARW